MGQGGGNAGVLLAIGVLVALHCCGLLASAVTWTVGDSQGWTIGPNYTTWAAGKTFTTGDVLYFPYSKNEHNVVEVSKAVYDACSDANAISTFTDGNTNVTLSAATASRYFLCSFSGHCTAGMKLAVIVIEAGVTPPSNSAGTSSPASAPPPSLAPSLPSAATSLTAALLCLFAACCAL